jgi:ABC-type polysaccharide/polyol phosphate export permease
MTAGLFQHTLLTLRLNVRNRLALIYGYLIPVLFMFAFAALFRETPRLAREMGQLLTIGTLGGACFGMPTGLVSERERGVWRRYRLLPVPTAGLVVSTMVARFVIVATSALLQIAVAWLAFRTPLPRHPWQLAVAFVAVAFALEGMGLVIAALADTVPAVQALGQAVFLPVIIIGGVGVPLSTLPSWAQTVAGFLPGRYAVESLQPCFDGPGLRGQAFALAALVVIGAAACAAGAKLFRWDAHQPVRPAARLWALVALAAWAAVGVAAMAMGRSRATPTLHTVATTARAGAPWESLTDADVQSVQVTGYPPDDGTITPVAPSASDLPVVEDRARMAKFRQDLDAWPPAHVGDDAARVRAILSAAAIADFTQDPLEGPIARAAFDRLRGDFDQDELKRLLTYIIDHPSDGTVLTSAPAVGLAGPVAEDTVRERVTIYARKLLGRLLGKLPDVAPTSS